MSWATTAQYAKRLLRPTPGAQHFHPRNPSGPEALGKNSRRRTASPPEPLGFVRQLPPCNSGAMAEAPGAVAPDSGLVVPGGRIRQVPGAGPAAAAVMTGGWQTVQRVPGRFARSCLGMRRLFLGNRRRTFEAGQRVDRSEPPAISDTRRAHGRALKHHGGMRGSMRAARARGISLADQSATIVNACELTPTNAARQPSKPARRPPGGR